MVVLLPFVAGCATLMSGMQPPEFSLINIEPLEAQGPFEQRARLDLRIINPNDTPLQITGFSFRLDVNDARFARGVSNQALTVPRLGEAKTSVVVTTGMLDMIRQLAALDKHQTPSYEISGTLYLTNTLSHSVSFHHAGKLERGSP